MRRLPVKTYLILSFMTIAFVPMLILGCTQFYKLAEEARQGPRNGVLQLDTVLENYVKQHKKIVDIAADYMESSKGDPEYVQLLLDDIRKNDPGFINLYVANQNGVAIAFSPTHDEHNKPLIGLDFSDRAYFKQLQETKRSTVVSSVFQGKGGTTKPILIIAAPIVRDTKFEGYVLGAIDLSKLGETIDQYRTIHSYPMVLDATGKVIYHPKKDYQEKVSDLSQTPFFQRILTRTDASGEFYSNWSVNGEFVVYKVNPHLGWTISFHQSNDAVAQLLISSVSSIVGSVGVTLVVTVMIAFLLTRKFHDVLTQLIVYIENLLHPTEKVKYKDDFLETLPYELQLLGARFLVLTKQVKENQQALIELNGELEQRVLDRTAWLQAVLESMQDGMILLDENDQVNYVNRRIEQYLHINAALLLEKSELDLTHLFDDISVPMSTRMPGEEQQHGTIYELDRHVIGKKRYVQVSSFPVYHQKKRYGKGFLLHDITKQYEVDNLKNELISLTSHEFKTPITSIKGSVQTLLRTEVEWDEAFKQELLEGIDEDISRIHNLVNDWLDISKIEAGSITLQREPVQVKHLIQQSIKRLPYTLLATTDVRVNVPENLPRIVGDKERLEQVLVNLLTNAMRYSDRAPIISIKAEQRTNGMAIIVQDNGIGISEHEIEKIFDKFYQVDASSKRRRGGTGLGLAICKGIIEAHNGAIQVQSQPNQGSTFTIIIPIFAEEGA